MNVLLVDDSKMMRSIQRRALEAHPEVIVAEASDGMEAIDVIARSPKFDVAVIDWNMPRMDGLDLVRKIRETDKSMGLIMCTTEAEKPRVMEALKAGINNYVVKPFSNEAFIEKILVTFNRTHAAK